MAETDEYKGYDQFSDFVERAKQAGVAEVVMSVRGDTVAKRVGDHSWTSQPVVEIKCTIDTLAPTDDDPLGTKPVTWTIREEYSTGAQEKAAVDRVARALRARGFSVATASAWAY